MWGGGSIRRSMSEVLIGGERVMMGFDGVSRVMKEMSRLMERW